MAFEPGNKHGKGREPGSKNVRTEEWEAFGKAIIEGNLAWMQQHMDDLKASEPAKAFDRLVELMEYFKPKLTRTAHTGPDGKEITVKHKWGA